MIRFKVVRASHLLLAGAILLLLVVLALLGIRLFSQRQAIPPASGSASLVDMAANDDEAKTTQVFASSDSAAEGAEAPGIDIDIVRAAPEETPAPSVLIYHTHTHEAYEQVQDDPYDALEAWRTTDADHSVVKVGEALAQSLRRYGFDVTHDTTDHEGDQLSTAYTRSLATLQGYSTAFDLYIDLHRDAYMEGEEIFATTKGGDEAAPLMMLIGNGVGFDEKPWYAQNYAFAQALEGRINSLEPGLCKPTMVKDGRYNQHIGVFSILVEVGHNRNTLRQALNTVPPLAKALYALMIEDPDEKLAALRRDWLEEHSRN